MAYASIAGLAMLLFARGDGRVDATCLLYVGHQRAAGVADPVLRAGAGGGALVRGQAAAAAGATDGCCTSRPSWGRSLFQLTGLVGLFDTLGGLPQAVRPQEPGAGPAR